jgi:hypothetical protein
MLLHDTLNGGYEDSEAGERSRIGIFLHFSLYHQPDEQDHESRPEPADRTSDLFQFLRNRDLLGTGLYTFSAAMAEGCISPWTRLPHNYSLFDSSTE